MNPRSLGIIQDKVEHVYCELGEGLEADHSYTKFKWNLSYSKLHKLKQIHKSLILKHIIK